MALSARVPANIGTYKGIPVNFSKQMAEAVHNKLVCWPLINSSYRKDLVKGDTVYIYKSNTVLATEVVVGTASASRDPFNTAAITLVVDQWFDAKTPIDDMTAKQSHIDVFGVARRENSYAIAKKIDTTVNTLFSTLNASTVLGTDGAAVTDDVLLSAWETLAKNDVPMDDGNLAIIVNPSTVVDFMKMDKLVSTLYGTEGPVTAGFRGFHKVYGLPVFCTNNLTAATTGAYAAMLHKEAIAGVLQEEPETELYDVPIEHQIHVLTTALWGVIEVRDTFGVAFYTRSK